MTKMLCVGLQKGGVSKTTCALHLALCAEEMGKKVLLVDLDTQGSASILLCRDTTISCKSHPKAQCAESIFSESGIAEMQPLKTESGVDLLIGHCHLEKIDGEYREVEKLREIVLLKEKLQQLPYDLIIFDTPPAIGIRQVAPMIWSDHAVIPIEPSGLAIGGLYAYLRTLRQIQSSANPSITYSVIVNRYNKASKTQTHLIQQLLQSEHVKITLPLLTNRVAVADCLSEQGVAVWNYAKASKATQQDWQFLCQRILHQLDSPAPEELRKEPVEEPINAEEYV